MMYNKKKDKGQLEQQWWWYNFMAKKKNCLLDISSDHFKELVMQPNFFMLPINMWAVFQEMLLLADNKV